MAFNGLNASLADLNSRSVIVSDANGFSEIGTAEVLLQFSDGSMLRAAYWRLIHHGATRISSFDHRQQYGLPSPINAIEELESLLENKTVVEAAHDKDTGDLIFQFSDNVMLQILNFSEYEVWEINFPNGTVEYSNRNK